MFFGPFPEEAGPTALVVHPFWVVVSIVNFLVLLYVLRAFMWGPIMRTLDTRAAKIREGLDMAEASKKEHERLKIEVERVLTEARLEAAGIAEKMTAAAESAAADIRAEAKAEADRIRDRGRTDAQQLHDQALAQLRTELASMVVLAASRLLGREIDPEKHRQLIEQSLADAGKELRQN
ncbi:MAG TPA: F0F1 ATP synthase subunit B [Candidatus Limnocylindria bacterium]|nr:F0F1 ATP synthase subunit B [Candidatus Limnocylindria bacterium]